MKPISGLRMKNISMLSNFWFVFRLKTVFQSENKPCSMWHNIPVSIVTSIVCVFFDVFPINKPKQHVTRHIPFAIQCCIEIISDQLVKSNWKLVVDPHSNAGLDIFSINSIRLKMRPKIETATGKTRLYLCKSLRMRYKISLHSFWCVCVYWALI